MISTPSDFRPSVTSTTSSSDSSSTITTSGNSMLLWISIGSSLMRVNALMGAPMRSGPYSGMACMYWSADRAVSATTLAAVTAP